MQNANMQCFLRPANFSRDLQLAAPGTTIFLHMQTTKVAAGFSRETVWLKFQSVYFDNN